MRRIARTLRWWVVVTGAVMASGVWLGASLSATASVAPGAEYSEGDGAIVASTAVEAAQISASWTRERMQAAQPGEALLAGAKLGGGAPSVSDDPTIISPRDGAATLGRGSSATLSLVPGPAATRARSHGKLFFVIDRTDYVCSGTIIRSKHLNVVVTAGHCVYSGDEYASEMIFVPAYEDGEAPFGSWVAKQLRVTQGWERSADLRYDVGMISIRRNEGGFIERTVGARGIGFNSSRKHRYHVYGYPGAEPFDGDDLYRCSSAYEGLDTVLERPRPMRVECKMTAGASGGGWIASKRRLLSVISYSYGCSEPSQPGDRDCDHPELGNVFGPYFGDQVLHLYNRMGGPPPDRG